MHRRRLISNENIQLVIVSRVMCHYSWNLLTNMRLQMLLTWFSFLFFFFFRCETITIFRVFERFSCMKEMNQPYFFSFVKSSPFRQFDCIAFYLKFEQITEYKSICMYETLVAIFFFFLKRVKWCSHFSRVRAWHFFLFTLMDSCYSKCTCACVLMIFTTFLHVLIFFFHMYYIF